MTDYGLITLLYQDTMGGLEVKGVDGEWIHAKPLKNSVLINAGDMLEIYTGGKLPATMHRVVIPEEEVKKKTARQSIVFFVHPNKEAPVFPLPGFEPTEDPEGKFQRVTAQEHVLKRFEANYRY